MQHVANRGRGISLREIFPDAQFFGASDITARSCCSDSRKCQPGDVFIALVGRDGDGHDHVHQAIQQGAVAVLAERLLPVAAPTCVVSDTREAWGHVCHSLAGHPADNLLTVGVTGSVGKTTTTLLLASVFEAAGQHVGLTSTIAYSDSLKVRTPRRTTPAPPVLAKWMSRMVGNGCGSAILELSSEALAQRRLAGVQLDAAVLTNVRRDHLEFHGSQLNYRNAKARLFNHLKETSGVSVLNVDDAGSQSLLGKTAGAVMTVGMHEQAELMATVVERYAGEQTFLLTAGNETAAVRTRMIGDQHVYNCLSAAAVGLVAGLDLATVVKGIEAVEMVPGRLQRIECGQPFAVYVDYARTPDSLSLCLSTIRKVTDGRLIVVYGAEGDRSGENRPRLGRAAERYADTTIITGHNPRHEEPLQIVHDILDGYDDPARAHAIPNRQRAIEFALSRARSGDAVIIAGKGHEDWQIVGSRKRKFSDADTARKWLYESVADQVDAIPFPRWKRSA